MSVGRGEERVQQALAAQGELPQPTEKPPRRAIVRKHRNDVAGRYVNSPRILAVLYLPENADEWLCHSEDALIAKGCLYWVSLRNAAESANPKHQTVYV